MQFGADTNPDHNSNAKCGAIGARMMIRHGRSVQIEGHNLSPLVELAVKFTDLYNHIFRKSKTD
jgi:hypothetical protein